MIRRAAWWRVGIVVRGAVDAEPRYRRSERVLAEDLGASIMLLDPGAGIAVDLNRSASRLWRRLAAPASRSDLIEVLARAYPRVARAALARDVDAFLAAARACHAIQEA